MLGDEEAAQAGKTNTTQMNSRSFIDNDYCKNKRVSCIKFHPTKPFIAAMAMVDNMDFDTRAKISGKSFESYVLVLDFKDSHIITMSHALESPIEVTTIEWHAENPNVLIGGCLNGQLIVWDTSCNELKIASTKKGQSRGDDDDDAMPAAAEEEDEEKSQNAVKMRALCTSAIVISHKNYVADIKFVPSTVNVTKN